MVRTLVAADMILDRPPSVACMSAMHASGDQCTATVPASPSTPDTRLQFVIIYTRIIVVTLVSV